MPRPGDRFVNQDYASTLRAHREGRRRRVLSRRDRAARSRRTWRSNGGIIDLRGSRAVSGDRTRRRCRPLSRSHACTRRRRRCPPASRSSSRCRSSSTTRPRRARGAATDADYLHYLIEAWKVRDPLRRVADPERWPVDVDRHLDAGACARRCSRGSTRRKASRSSRAADADDGPAATPPASDARIGRARRRLPSLTREGNMIVVTQTLSTWGGSFYVSKGLGFLYNNHLRVNRTRPGAYGQLLPLMRSSSTSVPTLVLRDARTAREVPQLAVGAPATRGSRLSVFSIITGVDRRRAGRAGRRSRRRGSCSGRDPADPLGPGAARADRGSLPARRARRPDRARAPLPEDRPQGRDALRLRGGDRR